MEFPFTSFYRRERLFESNIGVSANIIDIFPNRVTIRKELPHRFFNTHTNGVDTTPFIEINWKPFFEAITDDTHKFINTPIERIHVSEKELAEKLYASITECIEVNWNPKKFHVLSLTSGFDTRVVARIIRDLREKHGDEWIGDLVFYESGEEGHESNKIPKYLGLDNYPYYLLNLEKEMGTVHSTSLEFEDAWKKHSLVGWPQNNWYDPLYDLYKAGLIPEEDKVQSITGYGANETSRLTQRPDLFFREIPNNVKEQYNPLNNDYLWYFFWIYYHGLSVFPLYGDIMHPFYNFNVLTTMYTYSLNQERFKEIASVGGTVSKIIIENLDFGLLTCANRVSIDELNNIGHRTIDDNLLHKVWEDYKKSWYGTFVQPHIIPTASMANYSDWWGHWNMASLCEYMLKKGYTIDVEGE